MLIETIEEVNQCLLREERKWIGGTILVSLIFYCQI